MRAQIIADAPIAEDADDSGRVAGNPEIVRQRLSRNGATFLVSDSIESAGDRFLRSFFYNLAEPWFPGTSGILFAGTFSV